MTISPENIYDTTTADALEVGDQIVIDNEAVIILAIKDTDDIDEVLVKVENLDDAAADEWVSLYADDTYNLWSI